MITVELKHPSVSLDNLLDKALPKAMTDLLLDVSAPDGRYTFLVRGSKDVAGKKAPTKKLWGFDVERSGYILVNARPVDQGRKRYSCVLIPPPGTDSLVLAASLRAHVIRKPAQPEKPAAFRPAFPGTVMAAIEAQAQQIQTPERPGKMTLKKLAAATRKLGVAAHFVRMCNYRLGIRRVFSAAEARDIFKEAFDFPRTSTDRGLGRLIVSFAKAGHIRQVGTGRFELLPPLPAAEKPVEVTQPVMDTTIREMLLSISEKLDRVTSALEALAVSSTAQQKLDRIRELLGQK